MRNTAFTDIIFNWDKMSINKKLQRLQDFENMVARFQGRKPRIVTNKPNTKVVSQITKDRTPEAYFCRDNSNKICILDLKIPAIDALKNVIHEGFHAYIYDFITGKISSIKLYSKVDNERFFIEEENLPAISKEFEERKMMPLFDSFYIEEKLNYEEDSLYLVKFIMDSINSVPDAIQLQTAFMFSLAYSADNLLRGRDLEREFGVTYDSVVMEALNKDFDEKITIDSPGKIKSEIEPEFLKFFISVRDKYKEVSSLIHKPPILMNEEAVKNSIIQKKDEVLQSYKEYVVAMLKAKKKN